MIIKNCSDKELIFSMTSINEKDYDKIKNQTENFTASEIIQIIDRLSYYATQIKDSTDKYLWLELCIIDITGYKNLPSPENLLRRIEELEKKIETGNIKQVVRQPLKEVVRQEKTDNNNSGEIKTVKNSSEPVIEKEPKIHENTSGNEPVSQSSDYAADDKNNDMHSLWISILQSIESPPNRAFYSNLARPVEISEKKVTVAFSKEMFVKQAREGSKKQALVDAVSSYFNISNPDIEIIISTDADFSKKTVIPKQQEKKIEEADIRKQDEEDYHAYMESKNTEKEAIPKTYESSGTASAVRELFDGKYIN